MSDIERKILEEVGIDTHEREGNIPHSVPEAQQVLPAASNENDESVTAPTVVDASEQLKGKGFYDIAKDGLSGLEEAITTQETVLAKPSCVMPIFAAPLSRKLETMR